MPDNFPSYLSNQGENISSVLEELLQIEFRNTVIKYQREQLKYNMFCRSVTVA